MLERYWAEIKLLCVADPKVASRPFAEVVLHRDHQQAVERLEQQVAQLREEASKAGKDYGACRDSLDRTILELTTLRGLVEEVAWFLNKLTIVPVGCSREQELDWKKAVKDLRDAALPCEGGAQEVK